ncbi:MAG: efflux RND transporter permease subunit [Pseudomonadota bacterium]
MIRYFATHPTAANLMMVALLVVGLVSLPSLLRETFPRIEPRKVQISVPYPGATPSDVLRGICQSVEDAIDGVENVDEVICVARENIAVVTAEMRQGQNFERFTSDIEAEVQALTDLPEAAEDPAIEQLGRVDQVATVAVTVDQEIAASDLKALAEDIKARMMQWGGIPRVEVNGFSDHQIRIEVPEAAMRRIGISLSDIAGIIARQNLDQPAGEVTSETGSTILRLTEERRQLHEYSDIVIASNNVGGEVRLGDIATITDTFEDPEVLTTHGGARAALLNITKTPSDDTLQVMDALRAFIADEQARQPEGVALNITGDTSGILVDRLGMLVVNAVQGLALVFLAMWLFFGVRQAFWISAGLPVSFLGAIAAMAAMGYSLNMLTMVALLIVIGILMDDAIVIAENIAAHRAKGLSPVEASIAGVRQVAPGVVASFATTLVVFGSLAFLEGDLGELLRVIPVVMILVLVVSLIEAFLILPAHLSHGYNHEGPSERRADRWLESFKTSVVGPVVNAAIRLRYLTVGVAALLFLSSVAMLAGGHLKFEAFPEIDGDQIEARLELRAGASLEETQAEMAYVLSALDRVNEALSPRNPNGVALVRQVVVSYAENADTGTNGSHLATARIDLLDAETRGNTLDEILAVWRAEAPTTPAMRSLNLTEPTLGPAGRAIEMRLRHEDFAVLEMAADELQAWLSQYRGVFNFADNLELGRPEMRVVLRDGASSLGFDAKGVVDQLRAGFLGIAAGEVRFGAEAYEIDLRLSTSDRDTLSDIETFTLLAPDGSLVPLDAVAELLPARDYAVMQKINGVPTVTVTGDVDTVVANAAEIVRDTETRFVPELRARYPGLELDVQGQNAAAATTMNSMINGLLLGLIGVYLVLSFQLRSYIEPVVVMIIIPFALIGVVFGHLALGLNLSLPSMLGFVSLAGIVVNDSILLVNFIKSEHAPGVTRVADAAPKAALSRFRAIMLTSVTTIVGVLPLLTETSLQAQLLIPLVASIVFGLLATTFLILLVVPAAYSILDDFGLIRLDEVEPADRCGGLRHDAP